MAKDVILPALGPTMEEGTLVKWRVSVGDAVVAGDVIAEVETDKAVMDLEAVDDGVIAAILVEAGGDPIAVNTTIVTMAAAGEEVSVPENSPTVEDVSAAVEEKSSGYDAVLPTESEAALATSATAVQALDSATNGSTSDKRTHSTPTGDVGNGEVEVRATPLARRLARQFKLDLTLINGTGPRGRITRRDVESAAADGSALKRSQAPGAIVGVATPISGYLNLYAEEDYVLTPLTPMRKSISRRLTSASRDIPHFPISVDCELDTLMAQRSSLNADIAASGEDIKISLNDFIIYAAAYSLMQIPEVNATFTDDGIMMHNTADISVAVAMKEGLITPIIRNAETKSLRQISAEAKALAARAKEKKLAPEEYQGGTFSISNMGMFGLKNFVSIINPPQGAILSVGAINERAMSKNGQLYSANVMTVTLVCDHRAIDGLPAAEWIKTFKSVIENPMKSIL